MSGRGQRQSSAAGLAATLLAVALVLAPAAGGTGESAHKLPQVRTPAGALTIHRAQLSRFFPPGCQRPGFRPGEPVDQGFSIPGYGRVELDSKRCNEVTPGRRILVVWLSGKGDRGVGGMLQKRTLDRLLAAAQKAYVRSSDRRRETPYEVSTLEHAGARFAMYLAFGPRATSRNFKLVWPGNAPIALGT